MSQPKLSDAGPDTPESLERELHSAKGYQIVSIAFRAIQLAKRSRRELAALSSSQSERHDGKA